MFGWLAGVMLRRSIRRVNQGDIGPFLSAYADDATFVFPGQNSWAGEHRGKAEIERFYRRFVQVGLQADAHEIVVNGWPWDTTVCVHFTDRAKAPNGTVVYENTGVIFGKIAWGKIKYQHVYEDTEKVAEFDEYLAVHEPTALPA
ncbi:MAG: nuclear transport factor 2 family protein [Dehalococcoidia bacterium]